MNPDNHTEAALDGIKDHLQAYREVDFKIKEWMALRDKLRKMIENILGSSEVGTVAGRPAVRWTRYSSRRISTDLLRRKFTEDDLADCYVTQEGRRFSLVDGDE